MFFINIYMNYTIENNKSFTKIFSFKRRKKEKKRERKKKKTE